MRQRIIECVVDPEGTEPHDFLVKLPTTASISAVDVLVYDIADDASTDVASTVVDAYGFSGLTVRVSFHNMTRGKVYAVIIEADSTTGGTYKSVHLVLCEVQSMVLEELPANSRKTYVLDLSAKVPVGLTITDGSASYQAYDESDVTKADISGTLVARTASIDLVTEVDFENGQAGKRYVVRGLFPTSFDTMTNATYNVAARLLLPCGGV